MRDKKRRQMQRLARDMAYRVFAQSGGKRCRVSINRPGYGGVMQTHRCRYPVGHWGDHVFEWDALWDMERGPGK